MVALAINNGFRQDLQQRLLGSTSHISLQRIADDGIKDWPPLMDRLSKQPHVVAAAPAIFEQVLISRGPRARGAVLKGMIPRYETESRRSAQLGEGRIGRSAGGHWRDATRVKTRVKAADRVSAPHQPHHSDAADSPDSLAGVAAARGRHAAHRPRQGHGRQPRRHRRLVVLVTSPQGELTPFGMVPKYNRFRVVGIFNSGFFDYDSSWAFVRLSDAQKLFGLGDLISVIEFKIDDIFKADHDLPRQLEDAAGKGFMATN